MVEKSGLFDSLNTSNKEINVDENYFNNSDKFTLISIRGIIDTYNSVEFMNSIVKFCDIAERKVLVVNIKEVNYMSSTGIGAFVQINKHCLDNNIILYIMGIQKSIEEVFALLGFRSFFNFISELNDIKTEKIERSKFPVRIKCPHCSAVLNGTKVGTFRCKQCQGIFRISEENNKIVVKDKR